MFCRIRYLAYALICTWHIVLTSFGWKLIFILDQLEYRKKAITIYGTYNVSIRGCALINYVTSVIHRYHNFAKSGSNLLDQDFINMEV